jgi:hypothetical protein
MGGCRCGVAAMEVSDVKGEGFFNVYIYIYREREREAENVFCLSKSEPVCCPLALVFL